MRRESKRKGGGGFFEENEKIWKVGKEMEDFVDFGLEFVNLFFVFWYII